MKNTNIIIKSLLLTCITFVALSLFSTGIDASASSVSTTYGVYSKSDTISVKYTGANPKNKSWVSIYKNGTVPGKTPALAWTYVSTADGTVNFTPSDFINCADSPQKGLPLARGKYQAYVFDNSQYSYSCTPHNFWIEGDEAELSFDVLSDLHANRYNTYNANTKITNALTDLKNYSPSSKGIIVNGDAVDDVYSYDVLKNSINEVSSLPNMYFNLGNHELYTTPSNKYTYSYETKLYDFVKGVNSIDTATPYTYDDYVDTPYFQFKKGNSHFIFLAAESYPQDPSGRAHISKDQVDWAYNTVYRIAKKTPNDPIFVFIHEPFRNTVGGFSDLNMDNDSDLRWYLNKFPTVTVFTSHTHDDFYTGTWMYQEKTSSTNSGIGMTIFNTSSVGDIYKYNQDFGSTGASQGLHVDVYDDSVVVRARDFENKKWIKEYKIDLNEKRESLRKSNIG